MRCYRVHWSFAEEVMADSEKDAIQKAEQWLMDSLIYNLIKCSEPSLGEPSDIEKITCHSGCLHYKEEEE